MEEEVKKWLKKRMEEIPAEEVSKPEAVSKPVEAPAQEKPRPMTEEVNVEAEIEKSLEPVPEPSIPEVKEAAIKIPQIKESLNADADISKIYEQEKPEFSAKKGPLLTTKSKVLLVLIVTLIAFLVSWLYFYFPS